MTDSPVELPKKPRQLRWLLLTDEHYKTLITRAFLSGARYRNPSLGPNRIEIEDHLHEVIERLVSKKRVTKLMSAAKSGEIDKYLTTVSWRRGRDVARNIERQRKNDADPNDIPDCGPGRRLPTSLTMWFTRENERQLRTHEDSLVDEAIELLKQEERKLTTIFQELYFKKQGKRSPRGLAKHLGLTMEELEDRRTAAFSRLLQTIDALEKRKR